MDESSSLCAAEDSLVCCACYDLLDDPRQLQCLHNCCCKCANKIAAKEGGRSVKCPECEQVTDIKAAACNYFIAARVSRIKAVTDAKACGVCKEDGKASQPALMWCASCRKSLCAECAPGHAKYNRTHTTVLLDEVHSWDDACPTPAVACPQHGKPFDLVCLTCDAMRCVDCWASCNRGRHNVQHASDASVSNYVTKIRDHLLQRQGDLQRKLPQLSSTIGLLDDVDRAQDAALAELKQRKQRVMAAVDRANAAAAESIRNTFDTVRAKVTAMSSTATSLDRKVNHTINYSNSVAKTDDTCRLIHQQKRILSQFLVLSSEIDAIRPAMNVADMVAVKSCLPENLLEVITPWMGLPQLTADNPRDDSRQPNEASSTVISNAPGAVATVGVAVAQLIKPASQPAADVVGVQSINGQPRLNSISGCNRFMVSGECWDLAVTPEGNLLLAALWRGLKELDVSSGQELAVWKPMGERSQKWVTRVDCLPDGRAVIASSYKDLSRAAESTVTLLRRVRSGVSGALSDSGSSAWDEERHFVGLQSPAHQLSASGDILVIVQSEKGGSSWLPGRLVMILSLSSNETLWQRKLEYRVQSAAAAEQLLVSASSEKLSINGGLARYVVDGHSRDGDRLWRQTLTEQINDLCCTNRTPSLPESRLELCLAQRDGLWSIDVGDDADDAARVRMVGYTEMSEPNKSARVSIGRGPTTSLATLSENWRTVTVCAAGSDQ